MDSGVMRSSDEEEVFFDSTDCLPMEDCFGGKEEMGYEIWMKEPQSVDKRRERFLQGMGLSEFASPKLCTEDIAMEVNSSSKTTGLERLTDQSGAVSSSCNSPTSTYKKVEEQNEDETELSSSSPQFVQSQAEAGGEENQSFDVKEMKIKSWWKFLLSKSGSKKTFDEEFNPRLRMKVKQNKKKCMEFSALYHRQIFHAHKGSIWTMAFSLDGQFLASGGKDGIVRVWRVTYDDALGNFLTPEGNLGRNRTGKKKKFCCKETGSTTVVVPDKLFRIEESPVQEFHGHSGDVLDLAWTNSTCLLSSSMDKTVRFWKVGSESCLNVFHHKNYVTCIQLNPADENYFISGSVDGKVRIWGLKEKRVVDWVDTRDVITAISYQPAAKGFIVGSVTGSCRFYSFADDYLQLYGQINIQRKKKGLGKSITGIQFSRDNDRRVMVTSEDSKVYIFDGLDIIHKYKGLPNSGSQMSGSFTPSEKHIISVGHDSHVYIWNHDKLNFPEWTMKRKKSTTSCEHFFLEGVSVAIPWKGNQSDGGSFRSFKDDPNSSFLSGDSKRFSLSNWLFADGTCKDSKTWPEELLLPRLNSLAEEDGISDLLHSHAINSIDPFVKSETWGLIIVSAGLDGTIRTFHNYGLPVEL